MNVFPYVYDFASLIFGNAEARRYIRSVILFGSAATGEIDKQSDIDIFIDASQNAVEKLEPIIKDAEKRFYVSVEKKWALMGIDLPLRCIIADLDTYRWKEIKSEIISTGVLLYGKYEGVKEGLRHYSLFTFSTGSLRQKEKMRFIRRMFGYKVRVAKKVYGNNGMLGEISGLKLAQSILVPAEKSREVQKTMSGFKITPEIREIWIKQ